MGQKVSHGAKGKMMYEWVIRMSHTYIKTNTLIFFRYTWMSHGAKGESWGKRWHHVWMSMNEFHIHKHTHIHTHTFTQCSFTFTPILLLWCGGLLWRPHLASWRQNARCILAPLWRQYMALKYRPLAYWHQFKPKKIWHFHTHSHRFAVSEAVDYLGRCVLHKIKKAYGCSVWTAFAAAFCILAPKQKQNHMLIHIHTDWKKAHAHSFTFAHRCVLHTAAKIKKK